MSNYGQVALSREAHDLAKWEAFNARLPIKNWVEQAIYEKASRDNGNCSEPTSPKVSA